MTKFKTNLLFSGLFFFLIAGCSSDNLLINKLKKDVDKLVKQKNNTNRDIEKLGNRITVLEKKIIFFEIEQALKSGKSELAIKKLKGLIDNTDDAEEHVRLNLKIADIFFNELENPKASLGIIKNLLKDKKLNTYNKSECYLLSGKIYKSLNNYKESNIYYEKYLTLYHGNNIGNIFYEIAENYVNLKNYNSALKYYDKIISDYKKVNLIPAALFKKGEIYLILDQTDKAYDNFIKIVNSYKNSDLLELSLYKVGVISFSRNNSDNALTYLNKYISLFPDGIYYSEVKSLKNRINQK